MIHFWSMTTAQNVRNYLRNKPYLLEALEKGIVNLSELADKSKKNSKQETPPPPKLPCADSLKNSKTQAKT